MYSGFFLIVICAGIIIALAAYASEIFNGAINNFAVRIRLYIIQSVWYAIVNLGLTRGRRREGRAFCRRKRGSYGGKDGGGGVDAAEDGGANGVERGEGAALLCLGKGLAGHSERGSAAGGGGNFGGKQGKNALHDDGLSVRRARRRVVVSPGWQVFERPTYTRQRLIDADGIQAGTKNLVSF